VKRAIEAHRLLVTQRDGAGPDGQRDTARIAPRMTHVPILARTEGLST
jgi:hypothetical protein